MTARPHVLLSAAVSVDGYLDDASPERLLLSNAEDFDLVDEVRADRTCRATRNSCPRYCRPDLGPRHRPNQGPRPPPRGYGHACGASRSVPAPFLVEAIAGGNFGSLGAATLFSSRSVLGVAALSAAIAGRPL